jgi:putrescine importer
MSTIDPVEAPSAPVGSRSEPGLQRALGLPSLILFGLVYMVPLTVFTTYGLAVEISGGRLAVAYAVTLTAMAFTALSYARMAANYPVAGSAYAYSQKAFGAPVGFLAGWSLLLDYLFLPMLTYLVIGLYLHAEFPSVPAWVFIVAAIAFVTFVNAVGIVSVSRVNALVTTVQVIFLLVFLALSIKHIAGSSVVDVLAPIRGDGSASGASPIFSAAAVLCLSFLGFDAVSTLSEEAKDARRSVPRAIVIVTLACGALFMVLAYVSQLVLPDNGFASVDTGSLEVMAEVGGTFFVSLFTAVYIAAAIGAAMTAQASVARILYSMGRDGVLPKRFFGYIWPRFSSPLLALLAVAAVSLLAVKADLTLLISVVSFGALVAFSAVNLSVIKALYFDSNDRSARGTILHLILPAIGFALTVWLWTSLTETALRTGLIWLAIGAAWLVWITRGFRRPTPTLEVE